MDYEKLIQAYEVEVEFSDVSGVEHLLMFIRRSTLAKAEAQLTPEQHHRLLLADRRLLQQAGQFYEAIQAIADHSIFGKAVKRRSADNAGRRTTV